MVNIDSNAYEVILEKSKEDLTLEKLLILNPGSTSTKIAYYEDEQQIFVESISHSADEIAIAKPLGIPAFIYDGVTVDEMMPILKITGLKEISRKGIGHNLNTRAAAMKYARENGKEYKDCKLIVVHLGGGISVTLQYGGKVADIINDEDGPFAPERAGGLPVQSLIKYST